MRWAFFFKCVKRYFNNKSCVVFNWRLCVSLISVLFVDLLTDRLIFLYVCRLASASVSKTRIVRSTRSTRNAVRCARCPLADGTSSTRTSRPVYTTNAHQVRDTTATVDSNILLRYMNRILRGIWEDFNSFMYEKRVVMDNAKSTSDLLSCRCIFYNCVCDKL